MTSWDEFVGRGLRYDDGPDDTCVLKVAAGVTGDARAALVADLRAELAARTDRIRDHGGQPVDAAGRPRRVPRWHACPRCAEPLAQPPPPAPRLWQCPLCWVAWDRLWAAGWRPPPPPPPAPRTWPLLAADPPPDPTVPKPRAPWEDPPPPRVPIATRTLDVAAGDAHYAVTMLTYAAPPLAVLVTQDGAELARGTLEAPRAGARLELTTRGHLPRAAYLAIYRAVTA